MGPIPGQGSSSTVEPFALGTLGCGVLAIIGNCCCFGIPIAAAIAAIVLAFVSFSNLGKEPGRYAESSKALTIIGIVLAVSGALLHIAAMVFQFALPAIVGP